MKDLKKIIVIALSLVCLAGCSAGGETAKESETTAAVSAETTDTTTSETSEITAETESETDSETETTITSEEETVSSEISDTKYEETQGTEPENDDFNDDSGKETQAELSEGQSAVIKDLNGDGRDEEIFNYNPFGLCDITYYDSTDTKQTVSFDVMSVWGGTWYLSSTKQILNLKFYAHSDGTGTGFEMDLYDFSGADMKLIHTYSADGGYVVENGGTPSEMTYKIDDKDYSAGDFIAEAAALSELCEKELGYPLFVKDNRNEDNYIINFELTDSCGCNMLS